MVGDSDTELTLIGSWWPQDHAGKCLCRTQVGVTQSWGMMGISNCFTQLDLIHWEFGLGLGHNDFIKSVETGWKTSIANGH